MPKPKFPNRGSVDAVAAQEYFRSAGTVDGDPDLPPPPPPRRTWRLVAAGSLPVLLTAAGVLLFGNPQWHRGVYVAQLVVRGEVAPPAVYSGVWRDYYRNGQLKAEVTYEAGTPHGEFHYFYPDGTPQLTGAILRATPKAAEPFVYDGRLTGWHENGQKQFERVYDDERVVGKAFTWFANGSLQEYAEYDDGLLNGRYQVWGEDGRVQQCDEYYANGRRNGVCVRWEDGVRIVSDYASGVIHGRQRGFDRHGKQLYEHWYKSGQPSGPFDPKTERVQTETTSSSPNQG